MNMQNLIIDCRYKFRVGEQIMNSRYESLIAMGLGLGVLTLAIQVDGANGGHKAQQVALRGLSMNGRQLNGTVSKPLNQNLKTGYDTKAAQLDWINPTQTQVTVPGSVANGVLLQDGQLTVQIAE